MTRSRVHVRMVVTLLAVMLAIGGVTAAPVYAAETYTGGAIDAPQYILNDHTAVGFRWGAQAETTGLEASTSYYVKVRFTMTPSPSPTTNRGFTWNAAKQRWAQESEAWAEFPTVATDADGKIAARWVYAKFGDENSKGSYYVQVSLQKVGGGSTFNSSAPLQSMILDAATEGGWIHNGITLADVNARVAVRDADATTDLDDDPSLPYALGKTEVNTLDDDGDGTADNEDYGPTGSAGDFRMGVPADTGVTIFTKRVLRFGGVVTSPAADCDMAAGADDVGAPARVTGLAAEPAGETASGHVELAWDEATDSGDSGLAGYLVYRWEPTQTVNPKYTPAPMLIGQTNAGQTTFTDETAIDGTEYAYHVRAIDVATNVGPRSNTATVLPDGALPEPNEIARDWGTDRYATALAISRIAFADDSVETVVIATGAAFPDALAASGLAGVHGSPLLLVGAAVTADLIDELDRLGTTSVVLIGGEKAISADVFDALHAAYDVRRVSGADRYETAAAVAREIADLGGVSDAAYFVRGDESADALSVSPFAYRTTTPVLLIATGGVPTATGGVIDELGIAAGWIIGGPTAVNQTAAAELEKLLGVAPVRLNGIDRYATAAAVAQMHVDLGLAGYGLVGIATGTDFADALGGGAAVGTSGGVLLLTRADALPSATRAALEGNLEAIDGVRVFGGARAVSEGVYDEIAQIVQ